MQRTLQLAAILALLMGQAALSHALRHHIFFNDDHEQLARAFAFDELYVKQFSVHMPVPALVSKLVLGVFGFTHEANRGLAAAINAVIILAVVKLGATFAVGRRRLWAGVLAGALWLAFENDAWAFLNVSQLYSAAFLFAGLAFAFARDDEHESIELRRPVALGVCLALACMSRVMVAEQIVVVALATLLLGFRPRANSLSYIARVVAGGIGAAIAVLLVFADRLKSLIYWTLQHNMRVKAGSAFKLSGWLGNFNDPFVRDMDIRVAVTLLIALALAITQRKALLWLAIFAGGWLASNPSGISNIYINVIPALPAVCVLVAVAATRVAAIEVRSWKLAASSLLVAGLAFTNTGAVSRLREHARTPDASDPLTKTRAIASYIEQHSTPEDRVFVLGANPLIYPEARRRSATLASILYTDLALYQDEILDQLQASPPKLVVIDRGDYWFKPDAAGFPKVVRFLVRNYAPTENASVFVRLDEAEEQVVGEMGELIDDALGWHWSCSAGKPQVAVENVAMTLSFDHASRWSELTVASNLESSMEYVFTITSTNAFGHMFDAPDKRLRLLTRDSAGKLHWYWFGQADLVSDAAIKVPYRKLIEGDALDVQATITAVQVGGWGDPAQAVEVDSVRIVNQSAGARCTEREQP